MTQTKTREYKVLYSYIHTREYYSAVKGTNYGQTNNISESQKPHAEQKKPDPKEEPLSDSIITAL